MNNKTAKIDFKGHTRHIAEGQLKSLYGMEDYPNIQDCMDKYQTKVVLNSEKEIKEFIQLLDDIEDRDEFNGHMKRYRNKVRRKAIAKQAMFW